MAMRSLVDYASSKPNALSQVSDLLLRCAVCPTESSLQNLGERRDEISESRWREFRALLRKAVQGRVSLDHLVGEKRAHYPPPRSTAPVSVVVDNDVSDYSTVIEVGAPDSIGVLYDITRALAELTLDVRLAKVATYTGRVIDAFYVRDALGRKVTDPNQIAEIESAVGARLGAGRDGG